MAAKDISLQLAVRGVEKSAALLRSLGPAGEEAFAKLTSGANRTTTAINAIDRSVKSLGNRGQIFQQLGFQVGDFATQVAGGQSALIAFAQQGSQVAGLFGPAGAVIGAIIAVGSAVATGLIPFLFEAGDAAEEMGRKVDGAADSIKRLERAEAERASRNKEQRAFGAIGTAGGSSGPGGVVGINQLAAAAELRRAQAEDRGRDLVAERIAGNEFLAEKERQAEAERELARRTSEEKLRIAANEREARRELEEQRLREFERQLEDEIKATEEAAQRKKELEQARLDETLELLQRDIEADDRATEEKRRKAEAEAQAQADILAQPLKNLAGDISGIFAAEIKTVLEDPSSFSFTSIADSFSEAMSTAISGTIAAALTKQLGESAVEFGDYLSASLSGQSSSGTGAPGATGAAGGGELTAGSAAIGGAAGGYLVGSIYGQAAGKQDTYAATGGAIGGGLGAAAGFFIPGVGPIIGGAVGSVAGSFIGGLFGGEGLGNDRSSQSYRSGRGITYSDASFSPENRSVTAGILSEIEALDEAFNGLGGVVADFRLRIEAGNKTGITVNGKRYENAQDALRASIEELIGNTTGLSATQQTILANSKGETAQEIGADLAFGERYDQLTFTGTEFERALADLGKAFEQDRRKAEELGLSVDALAAARNREAAEIVRLADQQARNVQAQVALLGRLPGADTLDIQLYQLETDMRELAAAAAAVGIPLEQVTLAHQTQAQVLIDAAEAQRRAAAEAEAARRQAEEEQRRAEAERRKAEAEAEAARRRQAAIDRRGLVFQLGGYGRDDSPARQIEALSIEFQALYDRAGQLGVPLASVTQAFRRAVDEIIEADAALARQKSLDRRSLVLELGGFGTNDNSPARQIEALSISFQSLYDRAGLLGVPLSNVTKAFERAVAEIIAADAALQRQKGLDRRSLVLELAGFGAANDNTPARQIEALSISFQSLYDRAGQLGVPLSEVDAAFRRAVDGIVAADRELREQFNKDVSLLEASELEQELAGIRDRFAELIETAQSYGRATDDLVAIQRRAEEEAKENARDRLRDTERQLIGAQRDAFGSIDQFLDPLKQATGAFGIGQGVYGSVPTARSGLDEFRRTLELARTGDTAAISELVGLGQNTLGAARDAFASGPEFARVFKEVNAGLLEQQGRLEAERTGLLREIGEVGRETLAEIVRGRIETVKAITELRDELRRDTAFANERKIR